MIYKYFKAEHAIQALENGTIKLTPPNEFNDPYEFRVGLKPFKTEDFEKVYNTKKKLDLLYERVKLREKRLPRKNFNRRIKQDNLRFEILNYDLVNSINPWIQKLQDRVSEILYIGCFSKFDTSMLMWSHYADEHRGVVLGFDFEEEKNINETNLLDVMYEKERCLIDLEYFYGKEFDEDLRKKMSLTKSKEWEYEGEKRLLYPKKALRESADNIFVLDVNKFSIKETILGNRTSPNTNSAIRNIVNRDEYSHLKIFKSALKTGNYEIVNMPVDEEFRL